MTLVIGHGGASAVAPANTLRSFDAALRARADMIEFDVRWGRGRLVLAHHPLALLRSDCLALDDALDHLSRPRFAGVALNVDIKARGYERETLCALRSHGLTDRALVSSQSPAVIERVRELDRGVQTAISVGGPVARATRSWCRHSWRSAVIGAVRSGRFGDVMLEHRLIDAELIAQIGLAGRRAYAWTVDDPARFATLRDTGVAGIVTSNPHALRLHAPR